jgi:hypothetical protein
LAFLHNIQLFRFFDIATPKQPLCVSRSVCSVDFEKVRFEDGDEDELSRDELEKILLPFSARAAEDFDGDAEDEDGVNDDGVGNDGRSRGSANEMTGIDIPISVTTAVRAAKGAATVVVPETQTLGDGGFTGLLESGDEEYGESDEDPEVRVLPSYSFKYGCILNDS